MTRHDAQGYFALLADDPALAAGGPEFSLRFDEHRLDLVLTETSLYFSCELLRLDVAQGGATAGPANLLMAVLLEANCLGAGAGGALFALDETDTLRLRGQALLAALDNAQLAALLEDFLNHLDYWRPQLAALLAGAGNNAAPATAPGPAPAR